MYFIKKILNDIIDYAYPTMEKTLYKDYKIEIENKDKKTFNGTYSSKRKLIIVNNLNRDVKNIIKTTIHELAHHIDYCNRKKTDHGPFFYETYKELIYTALNMQLFTIDEMSCLNDNSMDHNKFKKMLSLWQPNFISYKTNLKRIKVLNCFHIKDELLKRKYYFNALLKTWEIEIEEEKLEIEKKYLEEQKTSYQIEDAICFTIEKIEYIIVKKDSFQVKDILKANDFFYDGSGIWKLKTKTSESKLKIKELNEIPELSKIEFYIIK